MKQNKQEYICEYENYIYQYENGKIYRMDIETYIAIKAIRTAIYFLKSIYGKESEDK